ncbi:MAG: sensor histidine kinase, partial [Anaerolineae bacterium]
NQLVSLELDQVKERLAESGLSIKVALADLPGLKGDPFRLRQAVRNLLDNAIKYADPDSTISVSTYRFKPTNELPGVDKVTFGPTINSGSWVGTSICNAAEPISHNELVHFFERFYRRDKARSQPQGTGLGLAIVREIVLAHGGRVEAACNGQTICLTLLLPADKTAL